ncbi:hypothetical protein JCM1840_003914 [Sporobolomyces johnsonii]
MARSVTIPPKSETPDRPEPPQNFPSLSPSSVTSASDYIRLVTPPSEHTLTPPSSPSTITSAWGTRSSIMLNPFCSQRPRPVSYFSSESSSSGSYDPGRSISGSSELSSSTDAGADPAGARLPSSSSSASSSTLNESTSAPQSPQPRQICTFSIGRLSVTVSLHSKPKPPPAPARKRRSSALRGLAKKSLGFFGACGKGERRKLDEAEAKKRTRKLKRKRQREDVRAQAACELGGVDEGEEGGACREQDGSIASSSDGDSFPTNSASWSTTSHTSYSSVGAVISSRHGSASSRLSKIPRRVTGDLALPTSSSCGASSQKRDGLRSPFPTADADSYPTTPAPQHFVRSAAPSPESHFPPQTSSSRHQNAPILPDALTSAPPHFDTSPDIHANVTSRSTFKMHVGVSKRSSVIDMPGQVALEKMPFPTQFYTSPAAASSKSSKESEISELIAQVESGLRLDENRSQDGTAEMDEARSEQEPEGEQQENASTLLFPSNPLPSTLPLVIRRSVDAPSSTMRRSPCVREIPDPAAPNPPTSAGAHDDSSSEPERDNYISATFDAEPDCLGAIADRGSPANLGHVRSHSPTPRSKTSFSPGWLLDPLALHLSPSLERRSSIPLPEPSPFSTTFRIHDESGDPTYYGAYSSASSALGSHSRSSIAKNTVAASSFGRVSFSSLDLPPYPSTRGRQPLPSTPISGPGLSSSPTIPSLPPIRSPASPPRPRAPLTNSRALNIAFVGPSRSGEGQEERKHDFAPPPLSLPLPIPIASTCAPPPFGTARCSPSGSGSGNQIAAGPLAGSRSRQRQKEKQGQRQTRKVELPRVYHDDDDDHDHDHDHDYGAHRPVEEERRVTALRRAGEDAKEQGGIEKAGSKHSRTPSGSRGRGVEGGAGAGRAVGSSLR